MIGLMMMIGRIRDNCSKNNLIVTREGCSDEEVRKYLGSPYSERLWPIVCDTVEDAVEIAEDLDYTMRKWAQVINGETTWNEVKKEKKAIKEHREQTKEAESQELEKNFVW